MRITEAKLRQIIREELEQSATGGAEQLRLADLSLDDLKPTALLQSVSGGYITIPRFARDAGASTLERWRDEWLEKDPNAVVTLQDNIYVVDPDLKRRFDREAQFITRQKERYGSY